MEREIDFLAQALQHRAVFFTGYPGSGKGTQGKKLLSLLRQHADAAVQHLYTGELFRAEVDKGTDVGKQFDGFMKRGEIIPSDITFPYLDRELSQDKYQAGLLLDGYPKDAECCDFILKVLPSKQIQPFMAVFFDIPREEVIERLVGRLHCSKCNKDYHRSFCPPKQPGKCDACGTEVALRKDDNADAITRRLDVFDTQTRPNVRRFDELGLLVRIDASVRDADAVTRQIVSKMLDHVKRFYSSSFWVRLPAGPTNSATFHGHIDAKDLFALCDIIHRVEAKNRLFQHKVTPVAHLQLGHQTKVAAYAAVYQCLPNFHGIRDALDEAFTTSRHGETGFDYDLVRATLEECFRRPNQGVMTELEEEVYVASFDKDEPSGSIVVEKDTMATGARTFRWDQLPGWKDRMISHVPKWELHHAIDIPKVGGSEALPVSLEDIHAFCEANGFSIGGWFVFRKRDVWAYRSNEFSDLDAVEEAVQRLIAQARALIAWVHDKKKQHTPGWGERAALTTSFSIERVWAIWKV